MIIKNSGRSDWNVKMTTIQNPKLFERLISDALAQDFSGWEFSYLKGRWQEDELPWNYREIVFERSHGLQSLLDIGTGGGEMLSTLAPLPPHTWATEAYPPNVPVAGARLHPLGCRVVAVESDEQALPFKDETFDLIIDRHECYSPAEVRRILKPGASFLTQQVGGRHSLRLNEWFQETVHYAYADWDLEKAVCQLEEAGFQILEAREAFHRQWFLDVGAVVFYLKVITWQIEDFTVERYYDKLVALHNEIQEHGAFEASSHYFYIEAQKES